MDLAGIVRECGLGTLPARVMLSCQGSGQTDSCCGSIYSISKQAHLLRVGTMKESEKAQPWLPLSLVTPLFLPG